MKWQYFYALVTLTDSDNMQTKILDLLMGVGVDCRYFRNSLPIVSILNPWWETFQRYMKENEKA